MRSSVSLLLVLVLLLQMGCGKSKEPVNSASDTTIVKSEDPQTRGILQMLDVGEEENQRTDWQNPDLILNKMGDLSGKTVADIGAGSGYFTFKLARTAEKVIALDIDPRALEYIESQKGIVGQWTENIEARLTPPDVPNLVSQEADAVLIVNTFSYIPNKGNYFERLLTGMASNAMLYIVDFKKGDIPVGPSDTYKPDVSEVRSILRKAGFRKIAVDGNSLEYQYIISAQKR